MAKIFSEIKDLEDDEEEEDHWSFQNKDISQQSVTGEMWTSTDVKKRWNWLAILCVEMNHPTSLPIWCNQGRYVRTSILHK